MLAEAVRVLTEAARLTNQPMRQGVSGEWEPDPNATPLPLHWAAFVTEALAGAANIGGNDKSLTTCAKVIAQVLAVALYRESPRSTVIQRRSRKVNSPAPQCNSS